MLNSKKTYFSIREVCEITKLEPHVLRYWESEFPALRPKKNSAGNRAYREKDIELVELIRRLVHIEKYTIQGARKKLTDIRRGLAELPEAYPAAELPEAAVLPVAAVPPPPVPEPEPIVPPPPPVVALAPVPTQGAQRIDAFALSMFDPEVQKAESFLSDRDNVVRELKDILALLCS